MDEQLKLDIFVIGLILIPVLVLYVPKLSLFFVNQAKRSNFPIYSVFAAIYIIFLSDFGGNWLGMLCLGVGYVVFFGVYAAGLSLLKETPINK